MDIDSLVRKQVEEILDADARNTDARTSKVAKRIHGESPAESDSEDFLGLDPSDLMDRAMFEACLNVALRHNGIDLTSIMQVRWMGENTVLVVDGGGRHRVCL